jgi:hypothetical protein
MATPAGLGPNAPGYDQLRQNAIDAYLKGGGSQQMVDQYFADPANQGDYKKLGGDAVQWYMGQNPQGGQQIADYFGLPNQQPAPAAAAPQAQAPMGGPGSINRAMQSAQTAAPQFAPGVLAQRQADEAAYGAGSGTIYDPWVQGPTWGGEQHVDRNGNPLPGYARGAGTPGPNGGPNRPGPIIQWDNALGPNGQPNPNAGPPPSMTPAGQASLSQPLSMGGQNFQNFQSLLDFMGVSTPGSQALKNLMEQRDAQGGTLQPGEGNLFDQFAPYLGSQVSTPPPNGTAFSSTWNPTGLLGLLRQAGLVG